MLEQIAKDTNLPVGLVEFKISQMGELEIARRTRPIPFSKSNHQTQSYILHGNAGPVQPPHMYGSAGPREVLPRPPHILHDNAGPVQPPHMYGSAGPREALPRSAHISRGSAVFGDGASGVPSYALLAASLEI